jgi:hypothetical protein
MTQTRIPTRELGVNGPIVGKIGFGAMGMYLANSLRTARIISSYHRHWSVCDELLLICALLNSRMHSRYYGKTNEAEAFKALTYALDRGLTYWDTAGNRNLYAMLYTILKLWYRYLWQLYEHYIRLDCFPFSCLFS